MNLLSIQRQAKPLLWTAVLACLVSSGVQASTCITAGRMDAAGWAPQFKTVRLLDGAGRSLPVKHKSDLTQVRAVELTEPALLSVCDGNKALTRGDGATAKGPVPAAKPGRFNVAGLGFPKLQTGGELVELEISAPADQVVMITR